MYALLIIDMQNDIVLPGSAGCVDGAYQTVPKIKEALDLFREKQWPVFFIVREYREDGSDIEITRLESFMAGNKRMLPGTKGCEIVDEIKPIPGEYRIVKNRFSAFMATELDFMLKRIKVQHIVVCGTQYPNCIRTTVFDGVCYGFWATVLTDATSAKTVDVAEANIKDMRTIGVECITVEEFRSKIS